MFIFNFLYLFLSITIFLSGLQFMKKGLEKYSESQIKYIILKFTSSPLRGFFTGAILTALIQSSSAVTIITIGLVNSGIINFSHSIGIILGSNIGTTITSQLFTLNILQFSPYLIASGLILIIYNKNNYKSLGFALLGFGLVFLGLKCMSQSIEPINNSDILKNLLYLSKKNNFITLIISTFFTGLIQSSSTVIAMTIVIAGKGLINLQTAVVIILGTNIGTCITAILAVINGNTSAKRVALAHFVLNLSGAIIFFLFISPFSYFVSLTSANISNQIANAHTLYNLICSLVILPFSKQYANFIKLLYKD